jgi:chromosomal replication initiator protein
VEVPLEVTDFIASQIRSNIRELEGALIRVIAYCNLFNEPLAVSVAQQVLKDMLREVGSRITLELIQQRVASYFQMEIAALKSASRHRSVLYPRQLAMFLCRRLTDASLPEIGHAFGGRDHTTVMHAVGKIEREMAQDLHKKQLIDHFHQLIVSASQRAGGS